MHPQWALNCLERRGRIVQIEHKDVPVSGGDNHERVYDIHGCDANVVSKEWAHGVEMDAP